jgi:hypothetical protein
LLGDDIRLANGGHRGMHEVVVRLMLAIRFLLCPVQICGMDVV